MVNISETYRPWQLWETPEGLGLFPKNSTWGELQSYYLDLNKEVLQEMKIPEGVKLPEFRSSEDGFLLVDSGTPVATMGARVAKHCEITDDEIYTRLFQTMFSFWNLPTTLWDSQIEYLLKGASPRLQKLWPPLYKKSYGDSSNLVNLFNVREDEFSFGYTTKDPRFPDPNIHPREWWTCGDQLYGWLTPQSRLVLDPTERVAGFLGMAKDQESFNQALNYLVTVWEASSLDKERFIEDGFKWFGFALEWNLREYCRRNIEALKEWIDGDVFAEFTPSSQSREEDSVQLTLNVIRGSSKSRDQRDDHLGSVLPHKLGYVKQLATKDNAQLVVEKLMKFSRTPVAELFS
jgi:hypothetical protein